MKSLIIVSILGGISWIGGLVAEMHHAVDNVYAAPIMFVALAYSYNKITE